MGILNRVEESERLVELSQRTVLDDFKIKVREPRGFDFASVPSLSSRKMLTTSLLSTLLVSGVLAVPQPQQIPFLSPPSASPQVQAIADDVFKWSKGAYDKVHKSVDNWVEQGVRKFEEIEHEGINCQSQSKAFPARSTSADTDSPSTMQMNSYNMLNSLRTSFE